MDLSRSNVNRILELVDRADFDVIDIEWKGLKLHLSRGSGEAAPRAVAAPAVAQPTEATTAAPPTGPVPAAPPAGAAPAASTEEPVPEGCVAVPAPTMGTFYRAPEPGAGPFVTEGSVIQEGDTLGIIEVMKVFSAITAETAGQVREIRAEDGALVEYGQVLFTVYPND